MITGEYKTTDGKYYVTCYGNGWAYEVTDLHNPQIEPLFFQDHDADQLQLETEDFTNTMMLDMYFEMIGN